MKLETSWRMKEKRGLLGQVGQVIWAAGDKVIHPDHPVTFIQQPLAQDVSPENLLRRKLDTHSIAFLLECYFQSIRLIEPVPGHLAVHRLFLSRPARDFPGN